MTLYEHAIEMLGEEGAQKFSKGVDTKKFKIICTLGAGAYAKVYLVEKFGDGDQPTSTFFAMKVLDKRDLK